MQILHVADVHLGKRQYNLQERELDFYNAFEKSIEIALRERVDAYVVAGDLFDTPVPYTSLQPLRVAVSGFRKLRERGIEVILLPGDHDKPKARGVPSIEFVSEMTGAKLLRSSKCIEVKGYKFCGLEAFNPLSESELERAKSYVRTLRREASKRAVLVAHVGVKDLMPFQSVEKEFLPEGFLYYALGHIHKYAILEVHNTKAVYPGSLETVSRDEIPEINNKGPVLVDLKDLSLQKIRIEVRPQVKVQLRASSPIELMKELNEIYKKVPPNSVVHLFVPENLRAYVTRIVNTLSERVLHVRIDVIKSGYANNPLSDASPTVKVSLLEVLKDIYGEKLGSKVYDVIQAYIEGNDEKAEQLLDELFKSGVWNRSPYAFSQRRLSK
ncbi:hypothetical protein EYM_00595 [Ignicoccus islandicus DSM 13165]|uniref:DNA double-strand break repair protein Mre11 n=1 Tax=Ignicoccus islandicus DSM 13165 TaxID=940295 RepID=A0A0U3G1B9_9CREN|nr:DNA repair exonuclease [Ignicoccus islandicus]ALU12124.1 hypothetical protein EYM_00595 [Ignicoccus islandicus DSM 13165]